MKFTLLIASVAAINIQDISTPNDDAHHPCSGIGEQFKPVSTAACIQGAEATWSVQDWTEVRTLLNPTCLQKDATKCCYKVTHGHDENLGAKPVTCDRTVKQ